MTFSKKISQIALVLMISVLVIPQSQANIWDDIKKKATKVVKKVVDKKTEKKDDGSSKATEQAPKYTKQLVEDTQQQLNRLGYNVGTIDGLYGNGTKLGIKHFQQDQNILVNGEPSSSLLSRMETTKVPENNISKDNITVQNSPNKTIVPSSKTASPSKPHSDTENNKSSLPEKPQGAEETITDLYLTIVRLRPDLLEKKLDPRNDSSLLDVMLRKDPERYGLDFKSVMKFINDEFTHNKRLTEYKSLVLNAAADAPLVYRHKVTSLLMKYNFDSQEYGIRELEMSTLYTPPFIRLFEGSKIIEAFKMSPDEAEALNKWHGNTNRENIVGFWNYRVKSLKHTSELSETSRLANGYIAEIEPLEFVIYSIRSVMDKSKKSDDPMVNWRRQTGESAKVEYQKLINISLKNLSKNTLLNVKPLPPFDIVGLKLGDTSEKVTAAIKSHNAALVLKKEMKNLNIPDLPPYLNIMSNNQGNRINSLDKFKIWFAVPPFKSTVISMTRELNLKDNPSPFKAVVSSLENKYGKPNKSVRHNSSNNSYYNHEYTWVDTDSTGKLNVIVGVRNNEFVQSITFRVNDAVNRQDVTKKYQRNQQLWKSYQKGNSNIKTTQAENVPDF